MKTCIFCDSDKACGLASEQIMADKRIDLGIIEDINFNLTIQDGNVLCAYLMDSTSTVLQEFTTEINYCPICGRRLKSWE